MSADEGVRNLIGTGIVDFVGLPLYPRMHIISDGRVFTSGTNAETKLLKTSAPGSWETVGSRKAGARDYHDNPTDLRPHQDIQSQAHLLLWQ